MSRILLGRKLGGIKQEKGLGLFSSLSSSRPNRLTSFPLYQNVYGRFDCWLRQDGGPSHQWGHIDKSRCCCQLLWIVFVVGSDEPLKMLDCQCRLPGILLHRVAFSQDQVVEPWQLTYCWLLGIDCAVPNVIDLILLVIASLKLKIQLRIIHSPLFHGILFQQGYMKDVVNPLFFGQFELISLFAYRM